MLKTVLNLQSLDLAGVELLQPFLCDRCQLLSFAGLMAQVFMGSSQHQLDPVQLVYLAGSGIIVHGNDVDLVGSGLFYQGIFVGFGLLGGILLF